MSALRQRDRTVDEDSTSDDGCDQPAQEGFHHSVGLRLAKRTVDVLIVILFVTFFGWIYFVLWIGVRVSSGSPVLYSQPRLGRNGKVFRFYKFRSMVTDADRILEEHLRKDVGAKKQWDVYQKLDHDPRVTRFGKFIRKTSLDELPQFWNVLIGDMSIVGPRPCLLSQKIYYGESWPYYCSVRPGITGLWQVSGRNKLNYSQRVELDVQYVKNLSMTQDFLIFVRTVGVVMIAKGSR